MDLNIPHERAAAVRRALGPDNTDFPEHLTLHMEDTAAGLALLFEGQNMRTLISTIDEVLEHVQVALQVID